MPLNQDLDQKKTEFQQGHFDSTYTNLPPSDKELSFDAMEKPQSVHLSREYYRWDMENNCENKYHKSVVFSF